MISKEEIQKMADLARIDISDEEVESLRGEMDDILEYVKVISEFHSDDKEKSVQNDDIEVGQLHNVMRDDENETEAGTYSKEIITEFPDKEGNYLKVKKIL